MRLKCTLEKPIIGRTLADLEPGVLALVNLNLIGFGGQLYRWRCKEGRVYGLYDGYPRQENDGRAGEYEVIRILGKIKMEICH
jgi:hypothetical protein